MISHDALSNFHKLVEWTGKPCECHKSDLQCGACIAKEELENINNDVRKVLEEIESLVLE